MIGQNFITFFKSKSNKNIQIYWQFNVNLLKQSSCTEMCKNFSVSENKECTAGDSTPTILV